MQFLSSLEVLHPSLKEQEAVNRLEQLLTFYGLVDSKNRANFAFSEGRSLLFKNQILRSLRYFSDETILNWGQAYAVFRQLPSGTCTNYYKERLAFHIYRLQESYGKADKFDQETSKELDFFYGLLSATKDPSKSPEAIEDSIRRDYCLLTTSPYYRSFCHWQKDEAAACAFMFGSFCAVGPLRKLCIEDPAFPCPSTQYDYLLEKEFQHFKVLLLQIVSSSDSLLGITEQSLRHLDHEAEMIEALYQKPTMLAPWFVVRDSLSHFKSKISRESFSMLQLLEPLPFEVDIHKALLEDYITMLELRAKETQMGSFLDFARNKTALIAQYKNYKKTLPTRADIANRLYSTLCVANQNGRLEQELKRIEKEVSHFEGKRGAEETEARKEPLVDPGPEEGNHLAISGYGA